MSTCNASLENGNKTATDFSVAAKRQDLAFGSYWETGADIERLGNEQIGDMVLWLGGRAHPGTEQIGYKLLPQKLEPKILFLEKLPVYISIIISRYTATARHIYPPLIPTRYLPKPPATNSLGSLNKAPVCDLAPYLATTRIFRLLRSLPFLSVRLPSIDLRRTDHDC